MATNPPFEARFEATLIKHGPIPPAGGKARKSYLENNGGAELTTAHNEFEVVVELLTDWAEHVPAMFAPIESQDDEARQQIQQSSRRAWRKLTKQIPTTMLKIIEPHIRASEIAAVNALNYLEDTDKADEAHETIHRAAFIRRGLFGCPIAYVDGQFWRDCTVSMSHIRRGLSAGITSDFYCSVCDEKMEDCDHRIGDTYPIKAKKGDDGNCVVCGLLSCTHKQGESYLVTATGIGREAVVHEVSLVARPRYPLSRIKKMTLEIPERYRSLAEDGSLHCDGCIGPCEGLQEYSERDWNLNDKATF